MAKKSRSKRRSATEVLNSLTRENIRAYITEYDALSVKLLAVSDAIQSMISAKLPEEHIEAVRATVTAGAFERRAYLEANVRRAALVLTRAAGFKHWKEIVLANIELIPSAEEKVTLSNM
jgi:hypothetical protein